MKFNQVDVDSTSLLAVVIATKIGGDIVASVAGNEISSSVGGEEVSGEMTYRSIASVISAELQIGVETVDNLPTPAGDEATVNTQELLFADAGKMAITLDKANKRFVAANNTPLAEVCSPYQSLRLDAAGDVTIGDYLENPFTVDRINSIVKDGVSGVGSLISVCRNETLPRVREVLTEATSAAKSMYRDIMFPFNIVQDDLPALWKETSFLAAIPKSTELTSKIVDWTNPLMGIESTNLDSASMLRTGITHLDEITTDTLASNYDLFSVWTMLTRQGNKPLKQLLENDPNGLVNNDNRRTYLTISFLMARYALTVGIDSMKVAEPKYAKDHFRGLVDALGAAILRNIELYESVVKGKTVIQRKVQKDGITELVVNAVNYKTWLQSSELNTPELLYSSSELLGVRVPWERINEERSRLAANWNSVYAIAENKRIQREREVVGMAVQRALSRYINSYPTPEGSNPEAHSANVKMLIKRLPGLLATTKYNSLDDLAVVAREMICKLFYADTAVGQYLTIYDRLGESHKDHDPRTIATLATIEYVGKWVASQLFISVK